MHCNRNQRKKKDTRRTKVDVPPEEMVVLASISSPPRVSPSPLRVLSATHFMSVNAKSSKRVRVIRTVVWIALRPLPTLEGSNIVEPRLGIQCAEFLSYEVVYHFSTGIEREFKGASHFT